jgi:hypothetical protein
LEVKLGDKIKFTLIHKGKVVIQADRPIGKIDDFISCLDHKKNLTIEEIIETIQKA